MTCSISLVDPISVPLIVFSSNAINAGLSPTVAITISPPFFTDFIAVSVTISAGANTIAASSKPYFSFNLSKNSFWSFENTIVFVAPNLFATSRCFCDLENANTSQFSIFAN